MIAKLVLKSKQCLEGTWKKGIKERGGVILYVKDSIEAVREMQEENERCETVWVKIEDKF